MNNLNKFNINALENIGNKLADFDEIPNNIKRYTILGVGNFGYAEKMKSKKNNNIYAIKKINKNSPNFNEKDFKRETGISMNLNHENLIKLYGYFEDKENINKYKEIYKDKNNEENLDNLTQDIEIYCLVLEFAEGGSLEYHYKISREYNLSDYFSQNFIIKICKQLLNGLKYLEKESVIHRDIKPDNILLDSNDNAKISDFGISAIYKRTLSLDKKNIDPDLFMNYTRVGRQDFVCPEIEKREHYYFEADIFDVGLTLLVLMSKEYPITLKVNPMNKKIIRIINDKNMYDYYNSYLKDLVLKMLNQNYNMRPKASEALAELDYIEKIINESNNENVNLNNNNSNNNIHMNNPMFNNKNNPMLNKKNIPIFNNKNNPMLNKKNNPMINNKNNPMLNKKNNPMINNMNNPMINNKNNPMINNMNNPMNINLNNHMNNPMINNMGIQMNNENNINNSINELNFNANNINWGNKNIDFNINNQIYNIIGINNNAQKNFNFINNNIISNNNVNNFMNINNMFNQNNNISNNAMIRRNNTLYNEDHIGLSPKINIKFNSEGSKISICTSINTTIEQLLKNYMRKIGINEGYIYRIKFFIKNQRLNPNSQDNVVDKLLDNDEIQVIGIKNLIKA